MTTRIKKLLVPAYALIGFAFLVVSGLFEDQYLRHVAGFTEPRPYPIKGVSFFFLVVFVESAFAYLILRPKSYRMSVGRALLAFIAFVFLVVYWGLWSMHSPPFYMAHVLWLLIGAVLLLILLCLSIYSKLRRAHNKTLQSPASLAGTSSRDAAVGP